MGRAVLILSGPRPREQAIRWITKAPPWTRIEFKGPRRTLPQNDKMWAMLTELSEQLTWHGQRYTPDDWKDFLMHQLRKARWMPDEEGGFVPIGMRTSDLSVEEMGDLIEVMHAFGARQGVVFLDPEGAAPKASPQGNSGNSKKPSPSILKDIRG
jgi:hypothetical protein